jgi:hypothetical protein
VFINLLYLHIINLKTKIMAGEIYIDIRNPKLKNPLAEKIWSRIVGDIVDPETCDLYGVSVSNHISVMEPGGNSKEPLESVLRDGETKTINALVEVFDNMAEAIKFADSILISSNHSDCPSQVIIESRIQGEIYDRQITQSMQPIMAERQFYNIVK